MRKIPHYMSLDDPRVRTRFRRRLLRWYDLHKRDLPWRADRDPYRVWLAEIMLQQTRVAAVLDHYRTFLQRFPTVDALAAAPTSPVLAAWSGLGYYRRARALHQAARKIVHEHKGQFPSTADRWRTLPGIGRYTAAAIASIAFNQPAAVVDGNVERVLQRAFGKNLSPQHLWLTADTLLSRRRPGDFNQAMMELGATVCLPRQPKCLICPLSEFCATRGELASSPPEVRQKRQIHYALDLQDDAVYLVQRAKSASLMPGMWELPEITSPNGNHRPEFTLRHTITVTDYSVQVLRGPAPNFSAGRWVQPSRVERLPLTGLARKILRAAKVI